MNARKGDGTITGEYEGGSTSESSASALVELPRALAGLPVDHERLFGEAAVGDFLRKLPSGRIDREVVRAIMKLAGSVGTGTMAEFVGDEQTLDLVREFGVDYAHGYHVGRPRPVAEL